jgi:hypothetical protein
MSETEILFYLLSGAFILLYLYSKLMNSGIKHNMGKNRRVTAFIVALKRKLPGITGIAFVINSLIVGLLNLINRWQYIDFSYEHWLKGMINVFIGSFIFSPFGCYDDVLPTVISSIALLVLSVLSLKYNKRLMERLSGLLLCVLIVYEILKLLLFILFSFDDGKSGSFGSFYRL